MNPVALGGTLKPLREQVAEALYEAAPSTKAAWAELPPERQAGWYDDADLVLGIVLQAAAWIADARDPEKPGAYLFRREHIGSNIRGLRYGGAGIPIPEYI